MPLLDSAQVEDKLVLRDVLYNFMTGQHPYQAVDDMSVKNQDCKR